MKIRYLKHSRHLEVIEPGTPSRDVAIDDLANPQLLRLPVHLVDEACKKPGVWIEQGKERIR